MKQSVNVIKYAHLQSNRASLNNQVFAHDALSHLLVRRRFSAIMSFLIFYGS